MTSFIPSGRRRTGDVARLPKTIRNRINRLLEDGTPYAQIAAQLTEKGHPLSEQSISRWRRGGHREWLAQEERLESMARTREHAIRAVKKYGGPVVEHASLSLAASQVYELLNHFDLKILRKKMRQDPVAFNRLLNTLVRLAEEGLKFERYREGVAERKANIRKRLAKAKPGGISNEIREWIERELKLL